MEHPAIAYIDMWETEIRQVDSASAHILSRNLGSYFESASSMVERTPEALEAGEAALLACRRLLDAIRANRLMRERDAVEAARSQALIAIAKARNAFAASPPSSMARNLGIA